MGFLTKVTRELTLKDRWYRVNEVFDGEHFLFRKPSNHICEVQQIEQRPALLCRELGPFSPNTDAEQFRSAQIPWNIVYHSLNFELFQKEQKMI